MGTVVLLGVGRQTLNSHDVVCVYLCLLLGACVCAR